MMRSLRWRVFAMAYDIQLETIPDNRHLAVVRRRASSKELSKVVPECCGIVWNVIRAQNIKGAGRHVALYLDCEINLEVGVELDAPFTGHGEVIASSLPPGRVATTVPFGAYNRLADAHNAIRD